MWTGNKWVSLVKILEWLIKGKQFDPNDAQAKFYKTSRILIDGQH